MENFKYKRTTWVNNSEPPLDAEHLNNIEDGITHVNKATHELKELILDTDSNTRQLISDSESLLNTKIDTVDKAVALKANAKGTTIALDDSANHKLTGLKLFGKSWQDAEPTIDNPQEIHSIDEPKVEIYGKNLFDSLTSTSKSVDSSKISFTNRGDRIEVDGVSDAWNYWVVAKTLDIGTYTLSGCPKGGSKGTYNTFVEIDGRYYFDVGDGVQFSIDRKRKLRFYVARVGKIGKVNLTFKPMLRTVGNSDFESFKTGGQLTLPYQLNGVPVESGGNYTDESGQDWIADYVDFEKGVLVRNCNDKMEIVKRTEEPLNESELQAYKQLLTLYPYTTILNDKGAYMSVNYVADTKNYIDNKFTELKNAILATGGNL